MKDKRLQTLNEKYSLPEKLRRSTKRVSCLKCGGNNKAIETYPKSDCSLCGGSGFMIEETVEIIDDKESWIKFLKSDCIKDDSGWVKEKDGK